MKAVTAENIDKKYGDVTAVRGIGFSLAQGGILGIIGPDGAGKTTLFRILTTLLLADRGTATVDGLDVVRDFRKIRSRIGYMPGKFSLYQDLTVEENLTIFATIFNTTVREHYQLIRDIYAPLEQFKTRRAGALSGGMKQKLALCCALIHKPAVLFLDEPTTGVDPVSRREFWAMLKNLQHEGISILVSTPYMDEAGLCDTIALMRNGLFLSIDTPENIVRQFDKPLWAVRSAAMSALLRDLRQIVQIGSCFAFGDSHHVTIADPAFPSGKLHEILTQKGHTDIGITPIPPGVEDCFMALAGEDRAP